MTLCQDSGNHHEDTGGTRSRPGAATRERRSVGRNDDRQRVADAKPRSCGVERVLREQMGIRGINVLRPVQVQTACPLVTEAEFPGAGDFALDRQIRLVCVTVDEVFPQRKRKRKNGKRKSRGQVILVGKERTGSKRIEALLTGQVKHVRKGVQRALENGTAVEIRRRIETRSAYGRGRRRQQAASGCFVAYRKQLHGAATVGSHSVKSSSQ